MRFKKAIYRILVVMLGIILQFIIHAVVESWYIGLLVRDFDKYGLGLTMDTWFIIHHVATVILFAAGILFGLWLGKKWWHIVYEN